MPSSRTKPDSIKDKIFEHLIREINDMPSFCIAMDIVNDLKSKVSCQKKFIDIISKLDELGPTLEQVLHIQTYNIYVCKHDKKKKKNKWTKIELGISSAICMRQKKQQKGPMAICTTTICCFQNSCNQGINKITSLARI
ncbi:hypothetical protein RFI_22755 [Reticulomyxa filosa]|uniref:Uncharacterized protein n=1 Tax=Reticulomyxa filosa TaxID=46433 RepID=X6MME6_RETFI|nr:hypothetical protein RFI_22755 [Reticulomyxa filosa]|eukprot:ETO14612.1 hypothetical protein RFI_22755 [Reticulomyxa filosa]